MGLGVSFLNCNVLGGLGLTEGLMGEVGGAGGSCSHRLSVLGQEAVGCGPTDPVPVWTLRKPWTQGTSCKASGLRAGGGLLGLPPLSSPPSGVTTRLGRCPPSSLNLLPPSPTQRAWRLSFPTEMGVGEPALMECLLNTAGPSPEHRCHPHGRWRRE